MRPNARRKRSGGINLVWVFTGSFVALWAFMMVLAHYHASAHMRPKVLPNNAEQSKIGLNNNQALVIEDSNPKNDENPWFGWQPKIATQMECSWQACLDPTHGCKTCRDENLGPAPSVPAGWIPDVTLLHRMFLAGKDSEGNAWPPAVDGDICSKFGGGDINMKLFDEVPLAIESTREAPKIFCGVYTMEAAHSNTIRAMRETWAPRCDGFLAFSTTSDPRIPAMAIEHEGKEEYNNMWQKSRAIWKFIGDHYLEDFDYFFLGGEDLFVVADNLRAYLSTLSSPDDDHFVGRRFKGGGADNYFNSGGAGYALSRGTLRKYITQGYLHAHCAPHQHTSMEDVKMAECLRNAFGIGLTDTRDSQGRERFHPFAPGSHLIWKPPEAGKYDWYEDYNKEWGLKLGAECCAPDSVSFHYIKKAAMVRHLHSMLYDCKK